MPHRVLNVAEVAAYLHLTAPDVQRLMKDKEIPFEKQGDRIAFRRNEIDAWASQRILAFSNKRLVDYHTSSSARVQAASSRQAIMPQFISAQWIDPGLASRTRASVIRDMVALADKTQLVSDARELLQTIEERERLCSTALPGGFALLHPRHHDPYMFSESFMVLGRAVQPIHFNSPDGNPTDLFFLVCCQDDRIHLHVLARLCTMQQQTQLLATLRAAGTASEMLEVLIAAENEVTRHL